MPPLNTSDLVAWYQQRVKELEEELRAARAQSPSQPDPRIAELERENQALRAQNEQRTWGERSYSTKAEGDA